MTVFPAVFARILNLRLLSLRIIVSHFFSSVKSNIFPFFYQNATIYHLLQAVASRQTSQPKTIEPEPTESLPARMLRERRANVQVNSVAPRQTDSPVLKSKRLPLNRSAKDSEEEESDEPPPRQSTSVSDAQVLVETDEEESDGAPTDDSDSIESLPPAYGPKTKKRTLEAIPVLKYEVFIRYGKTMDLWPEDIEGARLHRTRGPARQPRRPPFPAQLLSVPRSDVIPTPNMKFAPDEDAKMLIWMIRASSLFGPEKGFGLTSHLSPCLWHWAEQHRLTRRGWDSMKSRARQELLPILWGKKELSETLLSLLIDAGYFVFKDSKISGYHRRRVDEDNEASARNPESARLLRELPPPPPATSRKVVSADLNDDYDVVDIDQGEEDPVAFTDLEEPPPKRRKMAEE